MLLNLAMLLRAELFPVFVPAKTEAARSRMTSENAPRNELAVMAPSNALPTVGSIFLGLRFFVRLRRNFASRIRGRLLREIAATMLSATTRKKIVIAA